MLTDHDIDLVKSTVSMRSLAGVLGFKVSRAGFISCPFHSGDNTGSLKVYDGKRGFCCFGCHKAGNIFQFVMNYMHMDFEASVRYIAGVYSIPVSDGYATKEEYRASVRKAEERKAQQAKLEEERKAKRDRLNHVACELRKCQRLQTNFEPLGPVWCRLANKAQQYENEWYGLFEELYGDRSGHSLTELIQKEDAS